MPRWSRSPALQWLAEICVRRPVFALMLVMAMIVAGLAAYQQLGIDRFPKMDLPTIYRLHELSRRVARGDRDRDHAAPRRRRGHGRRHRRAALALARRQLAADHHVQPRSRHRRGGPGRARRRGQRAQPAAARHRSAGGPQAGSRLLAHHVAGRLGQSRQPRAVRAGRSVREERDRIGAGRGRGVHRRRDRSGDAGQHRSPPAGRLSAFDHAGARRAGAAERRHSRRPRRCRAPASCRCARWAGCADPTSFSTWWWPVRTARRCACATWATWSTARRKCARWPGSTASRPVVLQFSGSRARTRWT